MRSVTWSKARDYPGENVSQSEKSGACEKAGQHVTKLNRLNLKLLLSRNQIVKRAGFNARPAPRFLVAKGAFALSLWVFRPWASALGIIELVKYVCTRRLRRKLPALANSTYEPNCE